MFSTACKKPAASDFKLSVFLKSEGTLHKMKQQQVFYFYYATTTHHNSGHVISSRSVPIPKQTTRMLSENPKGRCL